MTHTATPYEVMNVEYGGKPIADLCILSRPECREVATIDRAYNGDRDMARERATAEFIVKACNSHEALAKALQEICELSPDDSSTDWNVALNNARAALKQAGA